MDNQTLPVLHVMEDPKEGRFFVRRRNDISDEAMSIIADKYGFIIGMRKHSSELSYSDVVQIAKTGLVTVSLDKFDMTGPGYSSTIIQP